MNSLYRSNYKPMVARRSPSPSSKLMTILTKKKSDDSNPLFLSNQEGLTKEQSASTSFIKMKNSKELICQQVACIIKLNYRIKTFSVAQQSRAWSKKSLDFVSFKENSKRLSRKRTVAKEIYHSNREKNLNLTRFKHLRRNSCKCSDCEVNENLKKVQITNIYNHKENPHFP
jgi:hypothetical protein